MKKMLTLFAVALALPLLFSCNKDNSANGGAQPVTLTQGENFNLAKTFSYEKGTKEEGGQTIVTRTIISTSSDGSFISWDQDETETKAVTILKKYNFQTGTYSVTVKDGTTTVTLSLTEEQALRAIVVEEHEGKSTVSFIPLTEEGDIPVTSSGDYDTSNVATVEIESEADGSNQTEVYTNGTWTVSETIAMARGADFSKPGLDLYEFASWASETLGVVSEEEIKELEGYKLSKLIITDSALSISFENGKSFATDIDLSSLDGFEVKDFANGDSQAESKISEYINGTGKFEFSGDLCILSLDGELKGGQAVSIILTLKRIN